MIIFCRWGNDHYHYSGGLKAGNVWKPMDLTAEGDEWNFTTNSPALRDEMAEHPERKYALHEFMATSKDGKVALKMSRLSDRGGANVQEAAHPDNVWVYQLHALEEDVPAPGN